ncbi:MAG TPA: NAD-dependent epimerase/dehydratase family protein [Chitinophagaceae bacterium]|jgi:nucleoside-diphosphate-sugar epimerase|nr:NAD-dependent epimerase/dehydratase family protein [Chitinophagaceae bacterium]
MVLVTGGTGFLGAYIIRNLVQKGLPVRALRRSAKTPFFMDASVRDAVEWVEGDVLDVIALEEALQGVDSVIHSAAVVSFHKSERQRLYAVNVDGTANVVNAAIDAGVRRFLHVSSVAALGRSGMEETVSENRKWEVRGENTHYAISKHRAELEVWRGFAEGLGGVMINPSTILGFGDWHQSSCAIFRNAYNEFPWYTNGVNGFVGVEDVAEAAVQLLQSDLHGKRYIVNAENLSFRTLFDTIADGFGKKKPHRHATPALGGLAWRLESIKAAFSGRPALLTRETARVAQCRTRFDNTALLGDLPGFRYRPLAEVIPAACKKYLRALENGQLTL